MFKATVYNVMVGSLSGTMEEVYAAKEVVRKWNQLNAEQSGILFLPVEWTNNLEDLKKLDVVVGIVGNYIENQDIIEECVKAGKKVLLFFNAYQNPKNTIQSESDDVKAFKAHFQDCCNCSGFSGAADINRLLYEQLKEL